MIFTRKNTKEMISDVEPNFEDTQGISESNTLIWKGKSSNDKFWNDKKSKIEWRSRLAPDELEELELMKQSRIGKTNDEKKVITNQFYTKLYQKHPDLKC
jgi:hypothetical protein